ncbi:glycosyltransferase [Kineococcus rhizosphaerae]|uniref:Glycosyltransferase involved in cell wall biosynthesis n=1 Tax=Kineococcus rhizosphaerae TaxID=559628 RepID=A0A2T0R9L9_9ACTN|nr:glycosyltransferase [Kineococcus rhizosphaerae]PRY17856.1 glycosyltransferase involved in cell wall biosynthesis [Kineococcus rhizosphaerae]
MARPGPTTTRHPSHPLRVLFVEGHLRENGGLRVVLDLARRFEAAGVSTTVFALEKVRGVPTAAVDPATRLVFGADATVPTPRRLPRELRRLVREARRHDVVVSGSEIGHGVLAGWLAARATRTPFVVLAQGDLDEAVQAWVPPHLRRLTRLADAHADATICVSPGLVAGIVANGQPPERTHVVVNGVDVDGLRARAAELPRRGRHGPRRVVALGRLTPHKGFDLLVRASAAVRARGLEHELLIAGEGDERAALERLVADLGADHVQLPGFTEHPEAVLAGADVFVSSSRTEAMPLTLLEALALGTPVIATDCSVGSRMLLDDGRLGRLVPTESLEALTEALAEHLADPAPLREAAAAGPEHARRFDPQALAEEHLRILARTAGVRYDPVRQVQAV